MNKFKPGIYHFGMASIEREALSWIKVSWQKERFELHVSRQFFGGRAEARPTL